MKCVSFVYFVAGFLRISPGMLQSFNQSPHGFVEGRGDASLFARFDDRAIHEVDFGDAFGEHVLKHGSFVFAGCVGAFLHKDAGIAVKSDAESFGNRLAFGDQVIKKLAGGGEARGGAVVEESEGADRIGGGVEDELGPLRAARVFEGDDVHAGLVEQRGKLVDACHGRVGGLEWADPGVAGNVVADVAGLHDVPGGKSGAADHELHALGDDFFVAHAILYGADRAILCEDVRSLLDGRAGVRGFGGDDAVVAGRDGFGVGSGLEARGEVGGAGNFQAGAIDGVDVSLGDVVGPDFEFRKFGEVCAEDRADGATADDANFHAWPALLDDFGGRFSEPL